MQARAHITADATATARSDASLLVVVLEVELDVVGVEGSHPDVHVADGLAQHLIVLRGVDLPLSVQELELAERQLSRILLELLVEGFGAAATSLLERVRDAAAGRTPSAFLDALEELSDDTGA